jgi:Mg2+/citrate symporter
MWYNSILPVLNQETNTAGRANVAQSVEQLIRNQQVNGSNPFIGSIFL